MIIIRSMVIPLLIAQNLRKSSTRKQRKIIMGGIRILIGKEKTSATEGFINAISGGYTEF